MAASFLIKATEPHDLLTRFLAACSEYYRAEHVQEFTVTTNIRNPHTQVPPNTTHFHVLSSHPPVKNLLDYLSTRTFVEVTQITARSTQQAPALSFSAQGQRCALKVEAHSGQNNAERFDAGIDVLSKHFSLIREARALEDLWPPELKRELIHQQTATDDLRESVARLGSHLTEQSKWFSETVKTKLAEVERLQEVRRQELQTEFDKKLEGLRERELAVAERESALDLKEYKAGRRAAYRRLVAALTGVPEDSVQTQGSAGTSPRLSAPSEPAGPTWAISRQTLAKRRVMLYA